MLCWCNIDSEPEFEPMSTYYPMTEYRFIGFEKSTRAGKMYVAVIEPKDFEGFKIFQKTNKQVRIHFGDSKMENYTDKTGLDAYPNLIHGDKKRRDRYISRHSGFIKKGYYSPGFFSMEYLW